MKVVFVNRYFHPDHSATSQLLSELAFDLATSGREVHVITSRQRYDDPKAKLEPRERINGVSVQRVWTTRYGRGRLFGRAFDYLTFYFTAGFALVGILRKGDILVAKTDPPLISVVAAVVAAIRGAVLVNWLQDVFPEVAQRLGVRVMIGPLATVARRLRDFSVRRAAITVVLGDRMAQTVSNFGNVPSHRLRVIHNWADGVAITPIEEQSSELRTEWRLGNRFVVAYSGNMGRAHEFETVLGAISQLRDEENLLFLFVGEGHQAAWLRSEVKRRDLSNLVDFRPYVAKERLAQSLGAAHVHLVMLKSALEGLIVPSKFYGIAAAGRATIFVGDPGGEIALLLTRHGCGYSVRSGDVDELARRIRELKENPVHCKRLGTNARDAFSRNYDRRIAVSQWSSVLDQAALETTANVRIDRRSV